MLNKLRYAAVAAVLATLGLAACEQGAQLTQPVGLAPKAGHERVLVTEYGENGFKMVQETDPTVGTVTAVIDQQGGSLSIGGTTLTVPAGAVSGAVTFTMKKPNGELVYDFSATKDAPNDVGSAGFPVPLTLKISYAPVGADLAAPTVVYIKPDGHVEPLATVADHGAKTMTASVTHFSLYGGADSLVGIICDALVQVCP